MIHVMVELETLENSHGWDALSIGAVVFGPEGLGAEFYTEVLRTRVCAPDCCGGFIKKQNTKDWSADWTALHALGTFDDWLAKLTDRDDDGNLNASVWGDGEGFEKAIRSISTDEEVYPQPWWRKRCYRTLRGMKPTSQLVRGTEPIIKLARHSALDTAKRRAEQAVHLMTHLRVWTV